jgi:hypothetical protein
LGTSKAFLIFGGSYSKQRPIGKPQMETQIGCSSNKFSSMTLGVPTTKHPLMSCCGQGHTTALASKFPMSTGSSRTTRLLRTLHPSRPMMADSLSMVLGNHL